MYSVASLLERKPINDCSKLLLCTVENPDGKPSAISGRVNLEPQLLLVFDTKCYILKSIDLDVGLCEMRFLKFSKSISQQLLSFKSRRKEWE